MWHFRHAFLTVASVAAATGCGARGGESLSENERAAICEPGLTRECIGPGACRGGQQCGNDERWQSCLCTNTAGASSSANSSASSLGGLGAGAAGYFGGAGKGASAGAVSAGGLGTTSKGGASAGGTNTISKGGASAGGTTTISKGGTSTSAGGTITISKGGTSTSAGGTTTMGKGGTSAAGTTTTIGGDTSAGGTVMTGQGGVTFGGTTQVPTGGSGVGGATNQPPTITSLEFSTSYLWTNDTLWVYPRATDPESNSVRFAFAWTRNGKPIGGDYSYLSGSDYFSKGDEIRVTVTPSDGMLTGTPVTSSAILVRNVPPYFINSPTVEPESIADDASDLKCRALAADDDGDTITYSYQWSQNSILTTYTGWTLPAAATALGDIWHCQVTITDGDEAGSTFSSTSGVEIANVASGIYRTDTSWVEGKSPYYVSNRIQVAPGVTLKIEPGVTVIGNQQMLESWGNISALGTKEKPIIIRELIISDLSTAQSPGKVSLSFVEFTGGAMMASATNASLSIVDSVCRESGYPMYLGAAAQVTQRFERNLFDTCCGIQSTSPLVLINNVFVSRWGTYCIDVVAQDALTATYNSFYPNEQVSVLLGPKSADIRNNYWGGESDADIPARITDNMDDLNIQGTADYLPSLAAPHADSPSVDKTYVKTN